MDENRRQTPGLTPTAVLEEIREMLDPWVPDGAPIETANPGTHLVAELGLDSIGILQLLLAIEKRFGIRIENAELDSDVFSRFENLVSLVHGKLHETV